MVRGCNPPCLCALYEAVSVEPVETAYADHGHGNVEFVGKQVQGMHSACLSSGRAAVQSGAANQHRFRAERHGFEHVGPTPNAAGEQDGGAITHRSAKHKSELQ